MGVRPPPSNTDDDDTTVSFGIAALDARLEDPSVSYPADAEEVVDALGDPEVPYDATGHTVRLSTALDRAHKDRFESEQEFLNALHPVFESYRERAAGGIVQRLRGMLPF
jgi:hypothetical protein